MTRRTSGAKPTDLLAVDDLQHPVFMHLADIASVEVGQAIAVNLVRDRVRDPMTAAGVRSRAGCSVG